MAFWSSQTLEAKLAGLVNPPNPTLVDCNAVTLRVGPEIFITPHIDEVYTQTKRQLGTDEPFQIPPEQFAFILTEERVTVPPEAMALISMKATYKMQGLINVSGFHVDPGLDGPLIFAVFNAGPSPVHLQRGLPLFLIWFADLDAPSEKRKSGSAEATIPPKLIAHLTNATDSLFALDKRLKEEVEKRREEDDKLTKLVHDIETSQERIKVTFAIVLTLLASLAVFAFREPLFASAQALVSSRSTIEPVAAPAPVPDPVRELIPAGSRSDPVTN